MDRKFPLDQDPGTPGTQASTADVIARMVATDQADIDAEWLKCLERWSPA